jgi:hypothetical protein
LRTAQLHRFDRRVRLDELLERAPTLAHEHVQIPADGRLSGTLALEKRPATGIDAPQVRVRPILPAEVGVPLDGRDRPWNRVTDLVACAAAEAVQTRPPILAPAVVIVPRRSQLEGVAHVQLLVLECASAAAS